MPIAFGKDLFHTAYDRGKSPTPKSKTTIVTRCDPYVRYHTPIAVPMAFFRRESPVYATPKVRVYKFVPTRGLTALRAFIEVESGP